MSAPPGPGLRQRLAAQLPLGVKWPRLGLGSSGPLRWRFAHDSAIQRDYQGDVWHAGHVKSIAAYGTSILAGSDTSGVWLINPAFDAIPIPTGFPAEPLSWDWPNPQISALATLGNTPGACFVASTGGPGSPLRVVRLGVEMGALKHLSTTSIPTPWWTPGISALLVLPVSRILVIGGPGGVSFSPIPADPTDALAYAWTAASGLPGGGVSDLTEGPAESVIAAFYGDGMASSAARGLFHGAISATPTPALALQPGTLATDAGLQRTSVATCPSDRSIGYAIASGPGDGVAALMHTTDGGESWNSLPIPADAGNQGWYNNCIAVHPADPATVAFGWRSGPFISTDSGSYWANRSDDPMHSDVHGLTFANGPAGVVLWAATDGGVFRSTDLGQAWDSRWNRHLLNLQFYNQSGAFDVCPQEAELFAGATQDNGNMYCGPNGRAWTAFRELEGGDGGSTTILDDRCVLHRNNTLVRGNVEFGNHIRRTIWQVDGYNAGDGVEIPAEGFADGLPYPAISRVGDPTHKIDGRLVLAVAGRDQQTWAYLEPSGGDDGRFVKASSIPAGFAADVTVTAVASHDGLRLRMGLSNGDILLASTASGAPSTNETNGNTLPGGVTDLDATHDSEPYALAGNGTVYRHRDGVWDAVTTLGRPALGIAVHPSHADRLYAACDDGVWVSADAGDHWTTESDGLPTLAQARRLCFVTERDGWRRLLSTYGWGILAAHVASEEPPEPRIPQLTPHEVKILFGIIQGGGGVEIRGNKIVRVPPRAPARELALLLGAMALGDQLGERGVAIREQAEHEIH